MRKLFLIILLFGFIAGNLSAKSSGTNSAEFLNFGVGGRAAGLGDAYTALATDGFAEYWNIAALAYSEKNNDVSFMYYDIFQDISQSYLSYSFKLDDKSAMSFAASYISAGDIDQTQIYNNNPVLLGSSYSAKDYYISFGYAFKADEYLKKNISLGINFKSISSEISSYSASALAVDLGCFYKVNEDLNAAFVLKNFGSKMKYVSKEEPLPLNYVFGISYRFLNDFLVTADLNLPKYNDSNIRIGLEYSLNKIFKMRLGYNSDNDNESGITNYGFGLRVNDILFDYAFLPYGILGDTHRFSLSYRF